MRKWIAVVLYSVLGSVLEKTKLDSSFTFLDHIVVVDGYNYMPEYEFAINSYDFRVVDRETKNTFEYPNSFGMVATSDDKCSIAYMYFWDLEIDYVGKKGEENPRCKSSFRNIFVTIGRHKKASTISDACFSIYSFLFFLSISPGLKSYGQLILIISCA